MQITIEKLDEWGACNRDDGERYSDANLAILFSGRESISILDALDLDIPARDKIWLVYQPGVLTQRQRKASLDDTVIRAVTNHALTCGIPTVEQWAQRWLSGADRTYDAAYAVAYVAYAVAYTVYAADADADAANATANYAAYYAVVAAAIYAADDAVAAAYAAAAHAAYAVAAHAAYTTDYAAHAADAHADAEYQRQIDKLRDI